MGLIEDRERALETDHRARERQREDILIKFRKLAWPDQFKIYKVIQAYFIHDTPGTEAWRELAQRAECVEAVTQAAEHLKLPEGEMPGVETYELARKELGLELSASTIIRRWYAWREVVKAAGGERVAMTPRQRAHFHAAIKQKTKGEEWLTGLREWLLKRDPEHEPSRTVAAYNAWADERNEKKPQLPPLAMASSIRHALVLPWGAALEVAKGDLNLADAQTQELTRLLAEDGEFIGAHAIALIFGASLDRTRHMTNAEDFPTHAFTLYGKRVWLLSDTQAHHAGQPFPSRTAGWLQEHILTSHDIRRLCGGLTEDELHGALQPPHCGSRIPHPAGRVAGVHYWFRLTVEAWLTLHQIPPAPTT